MTQYLLVLLTALLITAWGFGRYVHFFSVCYGFSIAGISFIIALMSIQRLNIVTGLILILLIFYGARLSGYLLYREQKSESYNARVSSDIKDESEVGISERYVIWIMCSLLYTLQTCPLLFRLMNEGMDHSAIDVSSCIGLGVLFIGIVLELAADLQKSSFKRANPGKFVSTGLYSFVRCPNYLGELFIWLGVFISGIGVVRGLQWIPAILGLLAIVYVMFSGARRLEIRQNRTYGNDPEYQAYSLKVPILIPFVPLYSVEKYTFLKA